MDLTIKTIHKPLLIKKIKMAIVPYVNMTSSLMHAIVCNRSGLAFEVGLLSPYQLDAGISHWNVIKRAMIYLVGIVDCILCYDGSGARIHGYPYTNWSDDLDLFHPMCFY